VHDLQLTPSNFTKFYRGGITLWSHPEITAVNDGCRLPSGGRYVVPVMRTDRSGANHAFAAWLQSVVPAEWEIGDSSSLEIDDAKVFGETGDDRVGLFIDVGMPEQSGPLPDRANNVRAGRIGFIDQTTASARNLPMVRVPNGAGEFVVPSEEGVHRALLESTRTPDGVWEPDYASTTPGMYPHYLVTYAMVPTELSESLPGEEADVLRTFLEFALSDEGQQLAQDEGFYAMPAAMLSEARAALGQLPSSEEPVPPPAVDPLVPGDGVASATPDGGGDSGGLFDALSDAADDMDGGVDVATDEIVAENAPDEAAEGDDERPSLLAALMGPAATVPGLLALLGVGLGALAIGGTLKLLDRRRSATVAVGAGVA
jgi:ABC-type phosphate transport system substrate-binding protein